MAFSPHPLLLVRNYNRQLPSMTRKLLAAHNVLSLVAVCPYLHTFLQTLLRRTDADLRRILGDEGFGSADGQRLVAAIHADAAAGT
jgi:hypothetical protein